jgi:hypothetical protein
MNREEKDIVIARLLASFSKDLSTETVKGFNGVRLLRHGVVFPVREITDLPRMFATAKAYLESYSDVALAIDEMEFNMVPAILSQEWISGREVDDTTNNYRPGYFSLRLGLVIK